MPALVIKKKLGLAVSGSFLVVALLFILLAGALVSVLGGILGNTNSGEGSAGGTGKYKNLCPAVLAYESEVTEVAAQYGMSQYVPLLLAQMQQESSGQGGDPMQASEGPYNKNYPHGPNGITDPHYSIECGVQELRDCLKAAGATGPADMQGIKLALQGYNFGNGYIDWVKQRGGYSAENAVEFSNMMAQKSGWASYGDIHYVDHVLQYYSADGTASGGATDANVQSLISVTDGIKATTHYVLGGNTPGQALDCSSYVCWAFTQAGIKNMPRVTAQGIYDDYCTPISPTQAKAGDIIFFQGTYFCGETITHVGIYLGNGQMMHCSSSADAIVVGDCTSSYWKSHFYAYGRVK
ncbi:MULTISPECIES: bifunctional lytic transglycosylase/C40 family peptidase [Caproicibacterium]|uniref:Bifunctional lytic transglycosylase/C40 family peptidase n=1 Tax=Caproicibacterium argilliputei TaxID=3030016 RepID=A0AA97H176_9FIRM|nr:bifunctional lytic transglycosylase/C40 family peptidase [Caproicibacterium argilliputei]WOC32356.1 bifunctional lytic transglycosylase/C40 family peptidase [Caproicibacterium argilliputei]